MRATALILLTPFAAAQDDDRDVRPVLADHCFPCHGPDAGSRRADLRLDRRADAMAAGVLSPGDPERSELLRRVTSADPAQRMPPPSAKKQPTPAEVERLRSWIAQGAPYREHWSFEPPVRPALPGALPADDARAPLDRFVAAGWSRLGIAPAPEAGPVTLARRASLALRGIPPTPTELEAFRADERPDAYERLVDRWLADPAYGEHRARHWLDFARYADTNGYHFDNFREAWAYRDWVIAAYQRDLPFDRFTIEQLAGDLLPEPTLDQRIATGFQRCNATTNEGGIIDEEYRVLYARERVETLGQVWLGLTTGCAACHDHKFDPLTQREFHQLAAFFENTTQPVRDGNVRDTPPILPVPLPQDRPRFEELATEIPATQRAIERRTREARALFDAWCEDLTQVDWGAALPDEATWALDLDEGDGSRVRVRDRGVAREIALDGGATWEAGPRGRLALRTEGSALALEEAGDFEGDQPFTCAAWVSLRPNDRSGAILARMDPAAEHRGWDLWMERRRIGMHLIHRWSSDAIKVVAEEPLEADRWSHVAVTYDGSRRAAGIRVYVDGVERRVQVIADRLRGTMRTGVPLRIGQREGSGASGAALQEVGIYAVELAPHAVRALAQARRWRDRVHEERALDAEEREALFAYWLTVHDGEHRALRAHLAALEVERAALRERGTVAHVQEEREGPAHSYVLARGAYDQRREQVAPAPPAFLPPWPEGTRPDRLGLARWLFQEDHPLTARVAVNHLWRQVFGRGLVETAGDFGIAGRPPTHPELLDELALTFRDRGWSTKALLRELVTSTTYRRSARATAEGLARDSENAMLARGPRFRMDAETLRDLALAASGLLVNEIGGASVKPYQPPGVWEAVAMPESNTRRYEPDRGPALYRRSLYTFWKRSAPPASMEVFDAPSRELCTVQRERTNTPLQALVTLNDPQFVEASRALAAAVLRDTTGVDAIADALFLRLAGRTLGERERAVCRELVADLRAAYEAHPDEARALLSVGELPVDASLDAVELATWTVVANQFLNLDEVLNR